MDPGQNSPGNGKNNQPSAPQDASGSGNESSQSSGSTSFNTARGFSSDEDSPAQDPPGNGKNNQPTALQGAAAPGSGNQSPESSGSASFNTALGFSSDEDSPAQDPPGNGKNNQPTALQGAAAPGSGNQSPESSGSASFNTALGFSSDEDSPAQDPPGNGKNNQPSAPQDAPGSGNQSSQSSGSASLHTACGFPTDAGFSNQAGQLLETGYYTGWGIDAWRPDDAQTTSPVDTAAQDRPTSTDYSEVELRAAYEEYLRQRQGSPEQDQVNQVEINPYPQAANLDGQQQRVPPYTSSYDGSADLNESFHHLFGVDIEDEERINMAPPMLAPQGAPEVDMEMMYEQYRQQVPPNAENDLNVSWRPASANWSISENSLSPDITFTDNSLSPDISVTDNSSSGANSSNQFLRIIEERERNVWGQAFNVGRFNPVRQLALLQKFGRMCDDRIEDRFQRLKQAQRRRQVEPSLATEEHHSARRLNLCGPALNVEQLQRQVEAQTAGFELNMRAFTAQHFTVIHEKAKNVTGDQGTAWLGFLVNTFDELLSSLEKADLQHKLLEESTVVLALQVQLRSLIVADPYLMLSLQQNAQCHSKWRPHYLRSLTILCQPTSADVPGYNQNLASLLYGLSPQLRTLHLDADLSQLSQYKVHESPLKYLKSLHLCINNMESFEAYAKTADNNGKWIPADQLKTFSLQFKYTLTGMGKKLFEMLKPMVELQKLSLHVCFDLFNVPSKEPSMRVLKEAAEHVKLHQLQVLRLWVKHSFAGDTVDFQNFLELFSGLVGTNLKKLLLYVDKGYYLDDDYMLSLNLMAFPALKTLILNCVDTESAREDNALAPAKPFLSAASTIPNTVTSLTLSNLLCFDDSTMKNIVKVFPNLRELNISCAKEFPDGYNPKLDNGNPNDEAQLTDAKLHDHIKKLANLRTFRFLDDMAKFAPGAPLESIKVLAERAQKNKFCIFRLPLTSEQRLLVSQKLPQLNDNKWFSLF